MPDNSRNASELIRLFRIIRGESIAAVEVPKNQIAAFASERAVTNSDVRTLIERLLQELPEQERKAFYVEIRTSGMI